MIAHETSLNTQSLNKQARGLKDISINLTDLITGQKNSKIDLKDVKEKEYKKENSENKENSPSSEARVLEFSHKKEESKPAKDHTVIEEKKVASSDMSVPPAADGEWEDI